MVHGIVVMWIRKGFTEVLRGLRKAHGRSAGWGE